MELVDTTRKTWTFFIVQDKVKAEERLVREDGVHTRHEEGTLLPWAKENKIKLTKLIDDDEVREFSFTQPV